MRSKLAVSIQRPPQAAHSSTWAAPTRIRCSPAVQRGQAPTAAEATSRLAAAPHQGQWAMPTNSEPKHSGQATVASDEPQ